MEDASTLQIWVFICQMLFYVVLCFLSCSVAVKGEKKRKKKKEQHTPPPPNCNNALQNNTQKITVGWTSIVLGRKVSLCGLLEQVLWVAELLPLTDSNTDNPNSSWWPLLSMPCFCFFSPLHFMLFLVGGLSPLKSISYWQILCEQYICSYYLSIDFSTGLSHILRLWNFVV